MSKVTIEIKDCKGLMKKLDNMKDNAEKVMKSPTSDARKRVPGWVAAEVTKAYGAKKSEITGKKLGTLKIEGSSFKDLKFIYDGRMLTHTHFSMSPKQPKAGGGYTLKATILKGERATLGKVKKLTKKQRAALIKNLTGSGTKKSDHSPIMLMRANGGQYLPFQRVSTNRNDIKIRKAISLPQMISNERTKENIQQSINDNLSKRIDHHVERYMKK